MIGTLTGGVVGFIGGAMLGAYRGIQESANKESIFSALSHIVAKTGAGAMQGVVLGAATGLAVDTAGLGVGLAVGAGLVAFGSIGEWASKDFKGNEVELVKYIKAFTQKGSQDFSDPHSMSAEDAVITDPAGHEDEMRREAGDLPKMPGNGEPGTKMPGQDGPF